MLGKSEHFLEDSGSGQGPPRLSSLLLTHHPLLSLQADEVWGWSPRYFSGANLLGRIYAAYREEFRSRLAAGAASVWEPVSARLEE